MKRVTKILKIISLAVVTITLASCGAGLDYNPETQTLTIVPGDLITFSDLEPDINADELYTKAQALEANGSSSKAFGIYKDITKDFPYTTKAPDAWFRMAQYQEANNKRKKAFDSYQMLIANYLGSPLYKPALERQEIIAHEAATGVSKNKMLFFNTRVPPSTSEEMINQVLANAPHAPNAPKTAFIGAQLWDNGKYPEKTLELYRSLTRTYPESGYSAEALFRIGQILHKQSLNGNTNLDNATVAVETFNELITLYPKHPKSAEAKQLISTISGYGVKRSLEVAQFYEKKKQFTSAIFYYKDVTATAPKNSEVYKIAQARLSALEAVPQAQ